MKPLEIAVAAVVLCLCGGATGALREKRQQKTVGKLCEQTTDCGTGSYCASNKLCACLSTYVDISGYCWRKINPGASGCTHDRQCDAVWPASFCLNGACRCANNQPAFKTRDGPVCLNYGYCPINGGYSKYRDPSGAIQQCPYGLDEGCPLGYDCMCGSPSEDCTNPLILTFCCPSRALACTMPLDQGDFPNNGGMTVERWFHNPVTSTCESFAYRGEGGNANNFETKDHCQSYCKHTCARGQPEYDPPVYPSIKSSVRYCSGGTGINGGCDSQYECTTVGTEEYCCPKPAFICSKYGGVKYASVPLNNYDEGSPLPSHQGIISYARYYYDESEKRCLSFTYRGQGGNFNNFLSQAHCDQFCSKIVCNAGEPLKDSSGVRNVICSGSNNCPGTHECTAGLCCPTKQTVCKMPKAIGTCGSYSKRWWFNATSGNCEEFTYSGCQGNANNFDDYKECSDYCRDAKMEPQCIQGRALMDGNGNFVVCGGSSGLTQTCPGNHYCFYDGKTYGCCPTQAYTCSLNHNAGTQCGPQVSRWYYDSAKRNCLTFEYNGCDGDSNNFPTQQDCKDYCRVENCPDGGETWKEPNGLTRSCNVSSDCPTTHYCTPITKWAGNRFGTYNFCCPTKDFVCSRHRDTGVRCTSSSISRWYFNRESRNCEPFTYNGCEGNRNNFPTRKACLNYCLSSACPAGSVVYQDSETETLATCTMDSVSACPKGFDCFKSELLVQPVCCGVRHETSEVCPAGSQPYVDALTMQPMQCTPNVEGSCPGHYVCWYSTTVTSVNAYYCCRKPGTASRSSRVRYVPVDKGADKDISDRNGMDFGLVPIAAQGAEYRLCSPTAPVEDVVTGCGPGVACQWADRLSLYVCCAPPDLNRRSSVSRKSTGVCPPVPPNLIAVSAGDTYRKCDPQALPGTSEGCPPEAACLYAESLSDYVCCKREETFTSESRQMVSNLVEPRANASVHSSDCGDTPGFLPVRLASQGFQYCRPSPDSCQWQLGGSMGFVKCMFSLGQQRFLCCSLNGGILKRM